MAKRKGIKQNKNRYIYTCSNIIIRFMIDNNKCALLFSSNNMTTFMILIQKYRSKKIHKKRYISYFIKLLKCVIMKLNFDVIKYI